MALLVALILHHSPTAANMFAQFGVATPVTESRPIVAGKPSALHPGFLSVVQETAGREGGGGFVDDVLCRPN
ncbi:hypothetical protein EDB84DRAFT_1543263 [Lactarius hengduanensis]|nr:hypothetical protein EDB84DRAFT_1543263 [Lactarius hengduanensis]